MSHDVESQEKSLGANNAPTSELSDEEDILNRSVIQLERELQSIQRQEHDVSEWESDSDVLKCRICNAKFSIFLRRHHCRICGKIHCYRCMSYPKDIPNGIKILHKPTRGLFEWMKTCAVCTETLRALKIHESLSSVLKIAADQGMVSLREWSAIAQISQAFRCFSLSQIRDVVLIQSLSPTLKRYNYTKAQLGALKANIDFFQGHSWYYLHVLKVYPQLATLAIQNETRRSSSAASLPLEAPSLSTRTHPSRTTCYTLRCYGGCEEHTNTLALFTIGFQHSVIRSYAHKRLGKTLTQMGNSAEEYKRSVCGFLSDRMIRESQPRGGYDEVLFSILVSWAVENRKIASFLYSSFLIAEKSYNTDSSNSYLSRLLKAHLLQRMGESAAKALIRTECFAQDIESLVEGNKRQGNSLGHEREERSIKEDSSKTNEFDPIEGTNGPLSPPTRMRIIDPIEPSSLRYGLESLAVMKSNSRPLYLRMKTATSGEGRERKTVPSEKKTTNRETDRPLPKNIGLDELSASISKLKRAHQGKFESSSDKGVLGSHVVRKALPSPDDLTDNRCEEKRSLIVKREDLRRDAVVLELLRFMRLVLKRDLGSEFSDLIVYDVLPMGLEFGVIRPVENCETLFDIKENMKVSLLNYILDNNQDQRVEDCRRKFVCTCASYSVMTYILGIGDRHLDNILVTKGGNLFHIDYGFSFGESPLLKSTEFRLTDEMVDVLGGRHSSLFSSFVEEVIRIHLCLRQSILEYRCIASQLIYDTEESRALSLGEVGLPDEISEQLARRCLIGSPERLIDHHMRARINENAEHPWYKLIDFFHRHNKQDSISYALDGFLEAVKSIFSLGLDIFG